jgi:hypothetical protein
MSKRIRARRGPWYRAVIVTGAAAVLLMASAIPPVSAASCAIMLGWVSRALPHIEDMQDGFESAVIAAKYEDLQGIHDACAKLHDAATSLSADMPTPDPALTVPLQAALDDFHRSANYCDSAMHSASVSDLNQATSYMNQGAQHMQDAIAVLEAEPPC